MIKVPITREGFEALVARVTEKLMLPLNDDMRVMAISFLHSGDRMQDLFDEDALGAYLWKAASNDMTFHIGQEIHKKRQEEAKASELANQAAAGAASQPAGLSVVAPLPDEAPAIY